MKRRTARLDSSLPGSKSGSLVKRTNKDPSNKVNHITECQRLRERLEQVFIDYRNQEEVIVALRALAKSLKQKVESSQGRLTLSSDERCFQLNVRVEELESENDELRRQLDQCREQLQTAKATIANKLQTSILAAVKAKAELQCVKSQLHKERVHSDWLQTQLVRYKVRQDDTVVQVRRSPRREKTQEPEDLKSDVIRSEQEKFRWQKGTVKYDEDEEVLSSKEQKSAAIFISRQSCNDDVKDLCLNELNVSEQPRSKTSKSI